MDQSDKLASSTDTPLTPGSLEREFSSNRIKGAPKGVKFQVVKHRILSKIHALYENVRNLLLNQ